LDAARAAAGITDWPDNALRHSFASYHLAHFNNSAALALEMGHTDSGMIFNHYRQLVRPKDAERYWNITPAAKEKVVQLAARA
jgi:integrase